MTIMIVSFTPKEILFASDSFRYFLKEGTTEDVLKHTLEIDRTNLKDHIETYETNCPKIHKITKTCGLIAGGDSRFSDIIEGLNTRKNITKQIMERLQQKGKLTAFWSCHIGRFRKGKAELTSIVYEKGSINVKESVQDNISFDSFAPEMKDVFFKKYVYPFYLSDLKCKITILNEFFTEITQLFNGLAGGTPIIAKIDKDGFRWIAKPKTSHTQNFTTYSLNFMPEKIETQSTTQYAWSSSDETTILSLSFEGDSTMLLLILADCQLSCYDPVFAGVKLYLDGVLLDDTVAQIGVTHLTAPYWYSNYSVHSVQIVTKGSHTLIMKFRSSVTNYYVYADARRLSILKSFYQGGTT